MTDATPAPVLACSLDAAEGAARARRWRALLDTHLLLRTPTTSGQRLTFPSDPDVTGEVDALVVAEHACCPFLDLTIERFEDVVILDVGGPPEAADIVATMFGSAS